MKIIRLKACDVLGAVTSDKHSRLEDIPTILVNVDQIGLVEPYKSEKDDSVFKSQIKMIESGYYYSPLSPDEIYSVMTDQNSDF